MASLAVSSKSGPKKTTAAAAAAQAAAKKVAVANAKNTVDNTTQIATPKQAAAQAAAVNRPAQTIPTPAAAAPAPAATAPTPAAPPPPPPVYSYNEASPFLTGTDALNFSQSYAKDQQTIANFAGNASQLYNTWLQSTAQNQQTAANNLEAQSNAAGANGVFWSGYNAGALADITANAVMTQNNYNTAYNVNMSSLVNSVGAAQADEATLKQTYANTALQNAATENEQLAATASQYAGAGFQVNAVAPTSNSFDINSLANSATTGITGLAVTTPTAPKTTYSSLPAALQQAAGVQNLTQTPGVTMSSVTPTKANTAQDPMASVAKIQANSTVQQ